MISWGTNHGPPFSRPVVGDLVGWFKNGFFNLSSLQMVMDPMVFFYNTYCTNYGTGVPKVVGEVQGAGCDRARVMEWVAEGNPRLIWTISEEGTTMKPVGACGSHGDHDMQTWAHVTRDILASLREYTSLSLCTSQSPEVPSRFYKAYTH